MGQPVGWDQVVYPINPGDTGAIANSLSTPGFDAPFEHGFTAGNNYPSGNIGFFESPGDESAGLLFPSTQFVASGSQGGLMNGNFTAPTAMDEGRLMTHLPIMQPGATASLNQTDRTPLHLGPPGLLKRRQRRGVLCPEGCGTTLSRSQDIDRHVAQKHAEARLRCPVDGCIKRFSRHDKRSDHLRKGHKLGAKDIDTLFKANLRSEKM
ncbi:hypothetical protein CC78DRAFT_530404 [Lojkania enalia]|uniref:C2H2-type domain-containing protein n=1 Tax=Lojkania enalia TaxID=147567 RepID=A0A9P4N676_9PLEO|nr:hypothetical protein CC78DRAFT_530404 [Didymosphaeria enalia]